MLVDLQFRNGRFVLPRAYSNRLIWVKLCHWFLNWYELATECRNDGVLFLLPLDALLSDWVQLFHDVLISHSWFGIGIFLLYFGLFLCIINSWELEFCQFNRLSCELSTLEVISWIALVLLRECNDFLLGGTFIKFYSSRTTGMLIKNSLGHSLLRWVHAFTQIACSVCESVDLPFYLKRHRRHHVLILVEWPVNIRVVCLWSYLCYMRQILVVEDYWVIGILHQLLSDFGLSPLFHLEFVQSDSDIWEVQVHLLILENDEFFIPLVFDSGPLFSLAQLACWPWHGIWRCHLDLFLIFFGSWSAYFREWNCLTESSHARCWVICFEQTACD